MFQFLREVAEITGNIYAMYSCLPYVVDHLRPVRIQHNKKGYIPQYFIIIYVITLQENFIKIYKTDDFAIV